MRFGRTRKMWLVIAVGLVAGVPFLDAAQAGPRYLISKHGAIADGQTLNSKAIQSTIERDSD